MIDPSIPGVLPSDVAAGTRPRNRRETIGKVAATMFAERGFENVRMDDIASASGITVRALYRHYTNKLALLAELVASSQASFMSALDDASATESGRDRFETAVLRLVAASRETSDFAVLWQREARQLAPEDHRPLRDRLTGIVSSLDSIIESAAPGLGPRERRLRAWAVISAVVSPAVVGDPDMVIAAASAMLADPFPATSDVVPVDLETLAVDPDIGRREQLLASAGRSFAAAGFASTGIDEIGRLPGVSGPSIYRHFGSKGDLLDELVRRRADSLWFELDRRWANDGAANRLGAVVESYVGASVRNPHMVSVWVTELVHVDDQVRTAAEASVAAFLGMWATVLRRVRPELTGTQATDLVAIAVQIVDDTVRIRRLVTAPSFARDLVSVVHTTLVTAGTGTD